MAEARVTQDISEPFLAGETSNARVTQVIAEAWIETLPPPPPPPPTGEPTGTEPGLAWTAGGINILGIAQDLIITEEDPGGFAEASFKIPARIDLALDIKRWSDLVIADGDEVIYQGRIERIERQSDASGQWATYQAWGWQRHAIDDAKYRGILRDMRLDLSVFDYAGPESPPTEYKNRVTADVGDDPGRTTTKTCIRVVFPQLEAGETVGTGDAWDLRRLIPTTYPRQQAKRVRLTWKCLGSAPANARFRVYSAPEPDDGSARTLLYDAAWTAADSGTSVGVVDVTAPAGDDWFIIRPLHANGSITSFGVSGRTIIIYDLAVLGTGYDPGSGVAKLRASSVADEIIQASCPAYDRSFITTTSELIDTLIYTESTPPVNVFNELLLFADPDPLNGSTYTWNVREQLANGLYRFTFAAKEQALAYITYGIELGSPAEDSANEYNELVLTYQDEGGTQAEVKRTNRVQSLTTLGITRTSEVDVGMLRGSQPRTTQANAQLIADAILRQSRRPARSGSFRLVGAQMLDAHSGGDVPFWRVRSGKLVFIGEASSLEPSKRLEDDPCVFRIKRIQKNLSEGYADVDIEQGTDVVSELVARLQIRG